MRQNFLVKTKGFSLIEVVITLAVMSVAITSMLVLMAKNVSDSQNAKYQLIAASLAQEGIELVRYQNDNTAGLSGIIGTQANYRIDNNNGLKQLTPYQLNLDANNFYSHSAGTASRFYRMINLNPDVANKKTTVTSYVYWPSDGLLPSPCNIAKKCVSLVSILQDK